MDERLRLIVELQNKASAEIRKLGKDLAGVKPGAGAKATASWFQMLETASGSANKALRPLAGGLNTIGVSGLAAGLSVAGLITQFRDLAKAMPALQELSRQTGISKTELERLKQTAANLNIDPSKMTAAIGAFSGEMVQFSKQSGEVYAEMQNGASGLARKIAGEWKEHPEQALKDYLGWLAQIPEAAQRAGKSAQEGVQIQRYWAQKGLGDADMAQIVGKGMGGFQEAYRQAAQDVGQITDEMVRQSEAFDRSITRFDASWNNLKRDLGAEVLPALTATTDGLRKLFDEVKNEPALAGIGAASLGALYARRRIMRAAGGGTGGIAPATVAKIEGAAVEQKSASVGFAEAVAEFKVAVAEFRAKGGAPGGGSPGGAPSGEPGKPGGSSPGYGNLMPGGILATLQLLDLAGRAPDELRKLQENPDKDAASPDMEFAAKLGDMVRGWFKNGASRAAAGAVPERYSAEARARDDARGRPVVYDAPNTDGNALHRNDEMPAGGLSAAAADFRVPAAYDREVRARRHDDLDGFVLGSLDRPVTHLVGTLKTAAAAIDGNVRPAAFHPAGGPGLSAALDPQAIVASGTKEGVLAAFREWAGLQDLDKGAGGGGGFVPTAFHMGGVSGGRSASAAGRAPSIRYGRPHSSAPYDDGGATPTGAHDPLKDLIAQHETGGTGAAGYDTAYGHAERGGPLAPPKPLTQMTIAEVLAYQREMKPRAGSPAFPVGRAQWTESTLRGLTRGMDPNTVFSPEVQEKLFDRSIAGRMGQGPGGFRSEWDSLRAVPDGEIDRATEGHREALRNAKPPVAAVAAGPDGVPGHIRGDLKIGDETYAYGSGGVRGSAHVPYGDYPINPDSRNPWGQAHNAMDVNNNGSIWDASLGRMRTGIEMHVAHSANMVTEGCLSFLKDQYPQLKARVKDMVAKTGHAYLHVDEHGASITPFPRADHDDPRTRIAPMPAVSPEPPRRPADGDGGQRAQIDPVRIDLHHHESGRTKIAAKTGRGVQLSIRTAPTLVQTA